MKKKGILITILLLITCVVCGLTACSGGGDKPPVDGPNKPGEIHTGATVTNGWATYKASNSRSNYIYVWTEKLENAGFSMNINGDYYHGAFKWSSNDNGKTVKIKELIFAADTPNKKNLPTTATMYNFNNKPSSYLTYDNVRWDFTGYTI